MRVNGLQAVDPRVNNPCQWRMKHLRGESVSAVCQTIHETDIWSAHPASSRRFRTLTGKAETHGLSSVPRSGLLTLTTARKRHSSEFSTSYSGALADQSHEGLDIASGVGLGLALSKHSTCLVGGTASLDDVSLTSKTAMHSGGDAIASYRCVAILETSFPRTSVRYDGLNRMHLVSATSAACERSCSLPSWGVFNEFPPVRTSASIRVNG